MTLIERIEKILTDVGYRLLPRPFTVGGLPFEFDMALAAGNKGHDIVVVADLTADRPERILVQRIQALARALDLAKSRRPLTAVLVGAEPTEATTQGLLSVCRVLPVGAPTEQSADQTLRDWLAVLLPLPQLEELSGIVNWEAELSKELTLPSAISAAEKYKAAAQRNSNAVEAEFAKNVKAELTPVLQEKSR